MLPDDHDLPNRQFSIADYYVDRFTHHPVQLDHRPGAEMQNITDRHGSPSEFN